MFNWIIQIIPIIFNDQILKIITNFYRIIFGVVEIVLCICYNVTLTGKFNAKFSRRYHVAHAMILN